MSPLHTEITQQPSGNVCGYFYKPGLHSGDTAKLMRDLISSEVNVYRLDQPVTVTDGVHEFGPAGSTTQTLPAGTLYIPMAQPQKHWIQAILGEDPFIPFPYFYDVVTWSYSLMRGMAGNGFADEEPAVGHADDQHHRPAAAGGADRGEPGLRVQHGLDAGHRPGHRPARTPGATVYRATEAFDFGGRHYDTGAGLVDGASISLADLAPKALKRDTPVYGLPRFVAPRKAIAKPKIAMWTGGTTTVPNPEYGTHCTSASDYCWARFTLEQKDGIPREQLVGLTTTQITAGELTNPANGYTAFVIPQQYSVAATNAIAPIIQTFVNNGGRFLSYYTGGTTSARNIGLTALNTQTLSPAITTPGSTYDGTFDTTNPVAWGFDKGGFIYRDASGNAVYNPTTLAGNGGTIPAASAPVTYKVGGKSYGYEVNSVGAGRLDGRPAVVDQPFGSGRAFLFASDPFFRAWHESVERQALNALIYPLGATLPAEAAAAPPQAPAAAKAEYVAAQEPVAAPIAEAKLPAVASRPVASTNTTDSDIRITVHSFDAKALRKAVSRAKLPKKLQQARDLPGHARQVHARHPRRARPRGRPRSEQVGVADHAAACAAAKVRPLFPRTALSGACSEPGRPRRAREGRRSPALPAPGAALSAGGLDWSGPSGRSAGVALRGVREGCRPLGHADRKHGACP